VTAISLLAVTVALNGAPKAEIVYPERCHAIERFAAEDLAHWVKEISGAELSVNPQPSIPQPSTLNPQPSPRIYVGRAFAEQSFAKDLEEIGATDGFAIREKDGDLYLFGGEPRSSEYAVCRLLEDNTDIIWARPDTTFGTVFTKNPTLEFTKTDKLEKPSYWLHGLDVCGVRHDHDMNIWSLRNGANLADDTDRKTKGSCGLLSMIYGHNYWRIANPKTDLKEHPEYFGYNATTKQREGETLCLLAPGLVDRAAQRFESMIDAETAAGRPPVDWLLLGMRGTWKCCQCEKCAAPIVLADGTKIGPDDGELHASTRYWTFVRDVCARLREKHPEIRYYGWGYHYGRTPPACELPKWLHCELDMDGDYKGIPYLDPRQDRTVRERILKWNELLPGHISYLESWFVSIADGVPPVRGVGEISCWQQNLRDMAHVLKGAGAQTYTCPDVARTAGGKYSLSVEWDASQAARWLTTRLLWNPDQDLAALKKFYYARTYREAAKEMEAFTEALDRTPSDPNLESLLQRALEKAQHPNAKAMIERQLEHWRSVRLDGTAPVADEIVEGTHGYVPDGYVAPKEPAVRAALETFRDRKLGLMMHWGPYCQLGLVRAESWPLSDADADWARKGWTGDGDNEAFKRHYLDLPKTFAPVKFDPQTWAGFAADNGFKYVVFTTKHHDGFCMFDSKFSDYKITNPAFPFAKDPRADIAKGVFDAFRAKGLGAVCYFSKPDWHHPSFWENCGLGVKTSRWPTYAVTSHPERWSVFKDYVRNQLLELVDRYGPFDALWLDGGTVKPKWHLGVDIEKVIDEARQCTPGLIAIDRTTGGPYENVITPEQTIPPQPILAPWESCITLGDGWAYRPNDNYKSAREVITMLVDVVAKGGNLALNVGPTPEGELPEEARAVLARLGMWLKANGAAIYATRPEWPWRKGDWAFTRAKDGAATYAIRLYSEGAKPAATECVPVAKPESVRRVTHLRSGSDIAFAVKDGALALTLPADFSADAVADAYRFIRQEQ